MRYGLISDVHGNLEALQACLAALEAQAVERLVFLGDAVGYGANPNEVCDILRARCAHAVLGNHDAAVAGRMDFSLYFEQARQSLRWCQARISAANLAWLRALPYTATAPEEPQLAFCHGSPRVPEAFEYLLAPQQCRALLPDYERLAAQTFIGHSHLPLSFRLAPPPWTDAAITALAPPRIDCRAPGKHIITVGSVGQPRDRDPRACCGVFDSLTGLFEYQRIGYDVEKAQQKIHAAGLPAMFAERLLLGH